MKKHYAPSFPPILLLEDFSLQAETPGNRTNSSPVTEPKSRQSQNNIHSHYYFIMSGVKFYSENSHWQWANFHFCTCESYYIGWDNKASFKFRKYKLKTWFNKHPVLVLGCCSGPTTVSLWVLITRLRDTVQVPAGYLRSVCLRQEAQFEFSMQSHPAAIKAKQTDARQIKRLNITTTLA